MVQLDKNSLHQMTSRVSSFHTINTIRPQRTLKIPSYQVKSCLDSDSKRKVGEKNKKFNISKSTEFCNRTYPANVQKYLANLNLITNN